MESTKPLIKNTRKKTLVIGSRSSNEYLKENRFSCIAVVFALAMAFAILETVPVVGRSRELAPLAITNRNTMIGNAIFCLTSFILPRRTNRGIVMDKQFSASTPSATSNYGPMCYECMR